MENDLLTIEQKNVIRADLVASAKKLLDAGVKYEFGAEWTNYAIIPDTLDCSEMIEGVFNLHKLKMPDGSQAQFDSTVISSAKPQPGDLAFLGRGGNPRQIYHVGMIFDDQNIIECRAFDPNASFETGKIILRPREKWETYKNWVGYTCHYKLL